MLDTHVDDEFVGSFDNQAKEHYSNEKTNINAVEIIFS